MKNAFISGVSSGIGLGLAKLLLQDDYMVYGVSRRMPSDLIGYQNFRFCHVDFANGQLAAIALKQFVEREKVGKFSKVFLNVGQFGRRIAPLDKIAIADLDELMHVNVWSHKVVLDCFLEKRLAIETVVFSSSIAGVRARAGNSGYAITKAALNMMAKLYSLENKNIHFVVLGLCAVDTNLSATIGSLPLEGNFPEIENLRTRARDVNYLVSADKRAADVLDLLSAQKKNNIPNGEFVEIRSYNY